MIHEVWRALGTTLLLLSLCLSQTTYSLHQIPDTEVLALRKIYEDMNGVAWNVKNDVGIPWNFSLPDADTHPCRPDEAGLIWQRILCADSSDAIEGTVCAADNCTIVALDFSYLEGLDGVVPDEIVQLGSLRSLVAEVHNNYKGSTSFTDQHGRMPGVVGNLTTLTELKLFRFEYSSGGIPEEYSKLVNLETLHIMNCNVSGPLSLFYHTSVCWLLSWHVIIESKSQVYLFCFIYINGRFFKRARQFFSLFTIFLTSSNPIYTQ